MNQPWKHKPLDEWLLYQMHHYYEDGEQCLFVCMIKGDRHIVEEGPDNDALWNRLWWKAIQGTRWLEIAQRMTEIEELRAPGDLSQREDEKLAYEYDDLIEELEGR